MNIDALFSSQDHHPVVITPRSDRSSGGLFEYMTEHRANLRRLLLEHGGILFRGFSLDGPDDFRRCAESTGAQPFGYDGGNSPRSQVAEAVYTSTEYPAAEVISLHNEMSYLPRWPKRLFFFCAMPPKSGGQTSLAHGRDILRGLSTEIVTKFRDKGLNYIRNFHPDVPLAKTWQATYSTQDRAEVEAALAEHGSTSQWHSGDALRVTTRCAALARHPGTGEEFWFNQAEQWHPSALDRETRESIEEIVGRGLLPHDCEYGDGEPVEERALEEIRHTLDRCKLLFDWQKNDALMLDNVLMMHGREAFQGNRRVLAYLSST